MKISASGMARNALGAIARKKELHHAKMCVSCFHDALLAVAQGKQTPEQIKDFFFSSNFQNAEYFGDVISFDNGGKQ